MKKRVKIFSLILTCIFLTSIFFAGCSKPEETSSSGVVVIKPSGTPYVSDFSCLYGIGETVNEITEGEDSGITASWVSNLSATMGFKSQRVWFYLQRLIIVNPDDSVAINQDYADTISNFLNELKKAGVEKISLFSQKRLHVYEDRNYPSSTIADPIKDNDKYVRALKIEQKAWELVAKEFPQVDYFEFMNEPDHNTVAPVYKNGYSSELPIVEMEKYIFTSDEITTILLDYCWYVRKGVKSGNPNAKVMLPALCHYAFSPIYLEIIYETIYGKQVPTPEKDRDTDPDDYFDVLNWHPYANDLFGINETVDEAWVNRQKEFYDVAVKYGDAEKPVWFTEFGYSDKDDPRIIGEVTAEGQTGIAPVNDIKVLEVIKEELPFIEAVCFFRLTNLYRGNEWGAPASEYTFGLFYNPDDPINKGKPKPCAIALFRYVNGGRITEENMKELCKYYYDAFGDIPEEYKCVITN